MRLYRREDLRWEKDHLFLRDDLQCYLVPDKKFPKMFWTKFPDGSMSSDYINHNRAKEWSIRMVLRDLNNGVEETDLKAQEMPREAH